MAAKPFKHTQALFVGSVMFLLLAVGFVSILEQTSSEAPATDTRAKAGISSTLKVNATVSSVDSTNGVIKVDRLHFLDSQESLGSWTVTPPIGFSIATVVPGTQLTLTIDPTTFLATTHTVTATQIKIER